MKKIVVFWVFLFSCTLISQNFKRVEVKGKIIVESNDIAGITIFNASSNTGTVTDENGEFELLVGLNDNIEVSALQFQNIGFRVNEAILESKNMKIFLIEEINKLDEIIVMPRGFTGSLKTDIGSVKTFNPKLDALYFGVKHSTEYNFEKDYKTKVVNMAVDTERNEFVNGLNIVNVVDQLLLPLFRSEVKNKKDVGISNVPVESIKYYFGSEFLVDNFKIPPHRVEEFIRFVEADDFDFTLLNYGKEMEFLELLNTKSNQFLNDIEKKSN